jgi:hypothetical protein
MLALGLKANVNVLIREVLMSFKNQKNLVVVGVIVAGLLAGTALLGGYAKFVPAKSDASLGSAFDAGACPLGRMGPCCAEQAEPSCCGEPCPPDCPKPCCAKEAAASGCGASVDAAGGCCPVATEAATQ